MVRNDAVLNQGIADNEFDEQFGGCFRATGLADESTFVQQQPQLDTGPFEPQSMTLNDARDVLAERRPKDHVTLMELRVAQFGNILYKGSESICCTIVIHGHMIQADSWDAAVRTALAMPTRRSA